MSRNLFPCPVKDCPGLREAGAHFCHSHTLKTPRAQLSDLAWFNRVGATDSYRRAVKAVSAIHRSSEYPTPLTGVFRRTGTTK